jgi:predicted metal-dependent peptidase
MPIDVIRKGIKPHKLYKAIVAVDVSGSISDEDVREFLMEISWIFHDRDAEIEVMTFDDGITFQTVVKSVDDLGEFKSIHGRGGTSFKEPYEYAITEGVKDLIFFTDGYGDWENLDPPPPSMHVWWICTTKNMKPPFGEIFELDK